MKQLESGDAVIVKFEPNTIGHTYQGAGWHKGVVVMRKKNPVVKLDVPRVAMMDVCNGSIGVHPITSTGTLEKKFRGTIIRQIPK